MKLQKLLSLLRQAIDDYNMIEENDVIAVGVSGGKDSLTLLYGLAKLKEFYPKKFELKAITVDLGFHNQDFSMIENFCNELKVPYYIEKTQISDIVFEHRNEQNPCSLCAKLRKGCLNEAITKLGCNKIAYAHHQDDVIETMFMTLFYEGRFYTFDPLTKLEKSGITLIRPLIYTLECDVVGFAKKYQLPIAKSACPIDGHTKREYVKQLVKQLNKDNPGIKKRLFHSITNGQLAPWIRQ